ncbi:hypothetical protein GCM10010350_13460 [Streptomyces galilaeus]|nr:hypothetical protein GCM10010350_13460 [Streptomyces galilaeus]
MGWTPWEDTGEGCGADAGEEAGADPLEAGAGADALEAEAGAGVGNLTGPPFGG